MVAILRHQVHRQYKLSLNFLFTYITQCLRTSILTSSLQWPFQFGLLNAYSPQNAAIGLRVSPWIAFTVHLLMFLLLNYYFRISLYPKKDVVLIIYSPGPISIHVTNATQWLGIMENHVTGRQVCDSGCMDNRWLPFLFHTNVRWQWAAYLGYIQTRKPSLGFKYSNMLLTARVIIKQRVT